MSDLADYRAMQRIRQVEDAATLLKMDGAISGAVHLSSGQEAVAVGAIFAIELPKDAVFATYRGHGWAIACGVPLAKLFAELLGKRSGTNGGRAGSAYLSAPEYGFYGENAIVGAGAPIAMGAALAARFDGSGRVVLCAVGDGAMNQGSVTEAMNMAALMTLPIVLITENNGFAEMTPAASGSKNPQLFRRASSLGLSAARVDGVDVDAVRAATCSAVRKVREGGGPVLLEMMTNRLVGHYVGDVEHYRGEESMNAARREDCIGLLRRSLLDAGCPATTIEEVEGEVASEVRQAISIAKEDTVQDLALIGRHLYDES